MVQEWFEEHKNEFEVLIWPPDLSPVKFLRDAGQISPMHGGPISQVAVCFFVCSFKRDSKISIKPIIFFSLVFVQEERGSLRPRLCHMKKGANGYGFNLHSGKSNPGPFIRAVDEDSPAQRSGLRQQDRIVQVANTCTPLHAQPVFMLFLIGESFTWYCVCNLFCLLVYQL